MSHTETVHLHHIDAGVIAHCSECGWTSEEVDGRGEPHYQIHDRPDLWTTTDCATIGIDPLADCTMVKAIWITPPSEGVTESVSLEMVAPTPKAFARIYSADPSHVDWGWVVHETAVCVWRNPTLGDDDV